MSKTREAFQALLNRLKGHVDGQRAYLRTLRHFTENGAKHRIEETNPHGTDKSHLDLGELHNFPIALPGEVGVREMDDLYVDLEGAVSFVKSKAGSSLIFLRPTGEYPVGGEIITTNRPELKGSPYGNAYGLARKHRLFSLVNTATGDEVRFTWVGDDFQVPMDLVDGITYRWQCADVATDGSMSAWSEPQSFQVPEFRIVSPTLELVDDDPAATSLSPHFKAGEFQVPGGFSDTHVQTDWLLKDQFGATVYELTSHAPFLTELKLPLGSVAPGETFVLTVHYHGEERGKSNPGVFTFTTKTVTVNQPSVTIRGELDNADLRPVFDIGPFDVVGSSDTFEALEVQIFELTGQLAWSILVTNGNRVITVGRTIDYGESYRLEARYKAERFGWSEKTVVNFTTTVGSFYGHITDATVPSTLPDHWAADTLDRWLVLDGDRWMYRENGTQLWKKKHTGGQWTIERFVWVAELQRFVVIVHPQTERHLAYIVTLSNQGIWDQCLGVVRVSNDRPLSDPKIHGLVDRQVLMSWTFTDSQGRGQVLYAAYRIIHADLIAWSLNDSVPNRQTRGFFTVMNGEFYGALNVDYEDQNGEVTTSTAGVWRHTPATGTLYISTQNWAPGDDTSEMLPRDLGLAVYRRRPAEGTFVVSSGDHAVEINRNLVPLRRWAFEAVLPGGRYANLAENPDHPIHLGNRVRERHGVNIAACHGGLLKLDEDFNPIEIKALVSPVDQAEFVPGIPGYRNYRLLVNFPSVQRVAYIDDVDYETIPDGDTFTLQAEYYWDKATVQQVSLPSGSFPGTAGLWVLNALVTEDPSVIEDLNATTEDDTGLWVTMHTFFN